MENINRLKVVLAEKKHTPEEFLVPTYANK